MDEVAAVVVVSVDLLVGIGARGLRGWTLEAKVAEVVAKVLVDFAAEAHQGFIVRVVVHGPC